MTQSYETVCPKRRAELMRTAVGELGRMAAAANPEALCLLGEICDGPVYQTRHVPVLGIALPDLFDKETCGIDHQPIPTINAAS